MTYPHVACNPLAKARALGRYHVAVSLQLTLLVSVAPAAVAGGGGAIQPFFHEIPAFEGSVGTHASLALDGYDHPHIAYNDESPAFSSALAYATWQGGSWTSETIDVGNTGFDAGWYTSIAIDEDGAPHISYYDRTSLTTGDLLYATKSAGSWSIETVDSLGHAGTWTSIAVDASGDVHISYRNETNADLRYALRSGGVWAHELVDGIDDVGEFTSIVLDVQGDPHIGYLRGGSQGDIRYAYKRDGTWNRETAVAGIGIGTGHTSLALDARGAPHIAFMYNLGGDREVRVAVKLAGSWVVATVDSVEPGEHMSLVVSPIGSHLSYYRPIAGVVMYASKIGAMWQLESVDEVGLTSAATSLALDQEGHPKIAYFDANESDLRYADAGIRLAEPVGGDSWPVGSLQQVRWRGVGPVSVQLSTDGGATYEEIVEHAQTSPVQVRVPHAPTSFARILVRRDMPLAFAASDSLFEIYASVTLLRLALDRPIAAGGNVLTWNTDPGPDDLAGYRIEKSTPASGWKTLVQLTTATEHTDADGRDGDAYRLFSVNGLGGEVLLGRVAAPVVPARLVGNRPNPFNPFTEIAFTAPSSGDPVTIRVFDATGRVVRTLVERVRFHSGEQRTAWDGQDDNGAAVSSGTYFARLVSGATVDTHKMVVAR